MKGILRATLTIVSFASLAFTDMRPFVVYGDDNRLDLYEVDRTEIINLSLSTVALVPESSVSENRSTNSFKLNTNEYGSEMGLCDDEPYFKQPVAAFCSGFLVAEDLIVTAGHCVQSITDCERTKFVFGFHMTDKDNAVTEFASNQVYGCAELVKQELTARQDYALVRLDRKVQGYQPLKISRTNKVSEGEGLFVVGHPSGLPTKIAAEAEVRRWADDETFFVANLDTYGGNSGSAVFNAQTLEVEGILVRGEQDFAYDSAKECRRTNVCASDSCRGEDITNIKLIENLIPEVAETPVADEK